jgi:hypothetical protein
MTRKPRIVGTRKSNILYVLPGIDDDLEPDEKKRARDQKPMQR